VEKSVDWLYVGLFSVNSFEHLVGRKGTEFDNFLNFPQIPTFYPPAISTFSHTIPKVFHRLFHHLPGFMNR
jgi:hypothetical protein